jgi:hypothetical protein
MNRLGVNGFLASVAGLFVVATPVWLGCESSSGNATPAVLEAGTPADTSSPDPVDSGANPGMDAETCGKLPPTGFTQVIQPRTDGSTLGEGAVLTLDKKGRPVFAYLDHPASANSTLYVVRWNDCAGSWYAPQKVDDDILGDVGAGDRLVAISTDPSDGRIGIAYEKRVHLVSPPLSNDSRTLYVATSTDDGATFTNVRVSEHKQEMAGTAEGDHHNIDNPAIVLGGGKTYVAYNPTEMACNALGASCLTATVLATGSGGTYAYELAKDSSDTDHNGSITARSAPIGLALDSDGVPGIVTHVDPATGNNTILAYYRPGFATYKPIVDTSSVQNDIAAAALSYDGKKPRVVSRIARGPIGAVSDYTLLFSASDDGTTWAAPVPVPQTGARPAASEKILASGGKVTILAGGPHVFRSADLTTFTGDELNVAQASTSVSGVNAADGKLWIGFSGTSPVVIDALGGVVLYREP